MSNWIEKAVEEMVELTSRYGEFLSVGRFAAIIERCHREGCLAPTSSALATIEKHKAIIAELREALEAARDVLVAFAHKLGYLPEQQAYATTMTEDERMAAGAVADVDAILARTAGAELERP
jgi:hypothetical protein